MSTIGSTVDPCRSTGVYCRSDEKFCLGCHTQTHPPVRNRAPLTTRSSSLRCVYLKPSSTLCRTVLQNRPDKTPVASLKKWSSMEHSPGLNQVVNGGDWGCIVSELETVMVLVVLAFNFIPQRSHHSLTLPRSRIRDSATVTLTPGMAQQP